MTLDDWGRMGRLLLDGTGADGAQVIAPDWLAFMKAPSPRDPEYGGQTWLNRADGSDSDGPTLFPDAAPDPVGRSEEHTPDPTKPMRHSYAVFCLKKTTHKPRHNYTTQQ